MLEVHGPREGQCGISIQREQPSIPMQNEDRIIAMIQEMSNEMSIGFGGINGKSASIEQHMAGMDQHLAEMERSLTGIERSLDRIEQSLKLLPDICAKMEDIWHGLKAGKR